MTNSQKGSIHDFQVLLIGFHPSLRAKQRRIAAVNFGILMHHDWINSHNCART
jgi:hypothetical protein